MGRRKVKKAKQQVAVCKEAWCESFWDGRRAEARVQRASVKDYVPPKYCPERGRIGEGEHVPPWCRP